MITTLIDWITLITIFAFFIHLNLYCKNIGPLAYATTTINKYVCILNYCGAQHDFSAPHPLL